MLQARGHSWKREFSAVFPRNGVNYLRQISSSFTHLVQEGYASV
jgi:hypothetical protein